MRASVLIKLIILLASLVIVIWASIIVREGSMEGFFASLTGVDPAKQINICPNRVHSFTFVDSKKIEESHEGRDLQWMAYDPDARLLNYLQVEKWLGEHCYIDAGLVHEEMDKLGPFQEALKFEYIDKDVRVLMQNSANPNLYSWDGRIYESEEMTLALSELKALAGW